METVLPRTFVVNGTERSVFISPSRLIGRRLLFPQIKKEGRNRSEEPEATQVTSLRGRDKEKKKTLTTSFFRFTKSLGILGNEERRTFSVPSVGADVGFDFSCFDDKNKD